MRERYCTIERFMDQAHSDDTQVTDLNPCSYLGFHLKHAALRGARQYGQAIEAFKVMLSKLDDAHDPDMRGGHKSLIPLRYDC